MATRKQVEAKACSLNVDLTITDTKDYFDIDAWSPQGYRFVASGCHTFVINSDARFDQRIRKSEMYAEALQELDLESCACERCTGAE